MRGKEVLHYSHSWERATIGGALKIQNMLVADTISFLAAIFDQMKHHMINKTNEPHGVQNKTNQQPVCKGLVKRQLLESWLST